MSIWDDDALWKPKDDVSHALSYVVQEAKKGLADAMSGGRPAYMTAQPNLPDTSDTEHELVLGKDRVTPNKGEKWLGVAARGAAGMAPFALEAPVASLASGALQGIGGEAGHEVAPNSTVVPLITSLLAGAAPFAVHPIMAGRSNRVINEGMQHPAFAELLPAVVDLEGGGTLEHPNVSPKGAMGPMQVMRSTADKPGFGIKPWDGKSQADLARVGRDYLAVMTKKYDGDHAKILAAYNDGPGAVDGLVRRYGDNWVHHLNPETAKYVEDGLQKVVDQKLPNGPEAPDGLPGNGSVRPIPSEDLAAIMNDPAAAGQTPDNVVDLNEVIGAKKKSERDQKYTDFHNQLDDSYWLARKLHDAQKQGESIDLKEVANLKKQLEADPFNFGSKSVTQDKLRDVIGVLDNILTHDESKPSDVLTPAERQEMDASVERPPSINEANDRTDQFSTNEEPPAAANDTGGGMGPNDPIFGGGGGDVPPGGDGGGGEGGEPPNGSNPEEKLIQAIKDTRPASQETQDLVHTMRQNQAKRLAEIQQRNGSLPEQLSALKGELPTADYESVSDRFTSKDVSALERKINSSKALGNFDKTNTLKALHKLLSPDGLRLPTEHELDKLADVFSPELIKALIDKHKGALGFGEKMANVGGIPRTIMSSTDVSAPARQGILFVGRKEFWSNYPKMIKMFFNKNYYDAQMAEIKNRPTYPLMRTGGLAVRDSPLMVDREEYFMSNMAEHMPGEKLPGIGLTVKGYNNTVGALVRASDRAYTGYLRRLRADVFDSLHAKGEDLGVEWNATKLKALARFINTATGRGNLGKFEQASQAASTVFFAPRLIKARIDTLANPAYYAELYKADPFIAKEAAKSLGSFAAFAGTALSLAVAGGAKVEWDPRSSDFLKLRFGETRVDFLGGIPQYLVLAAREAMGQTKTLNGDIKDLTTGDYGATSRWDVLMNFGSNKLAPIPGYVRDFLKGKKPTGEPFKPIMGLFQLFLPMDVSATIDSVQTNGPKGAWAFLPSFLGENVDTYKEYPKKGKAKDPFNDPSLWGGNKKDVFDNPKLWGN